MSKGNIHQPKGTTMTANTNITLQRLAKAVATNNGTNEIALERIAKAIGKTCDLKSRKFQMAAGEATSYLIIEATFNTICPLVNAVLAGGMAAAFIFFIAPALTTQMAIAGFIACLLLGDLIPAIIYALLITPHRTRFTNLTGIDLKDAIDGKLDKAL